MHLQEEEIVKSELAMTVDRISTKFVLIPAGEVIIGSPKGALASDFERPQRTVLIDAFYLAECPVTERIFRIFANATGEEDKFSWSDDPEVPMTRVNWTEAKQFCEWLSREDGRRFRLPTECEWEKAARGGLSEKLFPWGNEDPTDLACWNRWECEFGVQAVMSYPPNAYGLYDMVGNVWEWCQDAYLDDAYALYSLENPVIDPAGHDGNPLRVRRGASWNVGESFRLRVANRGAMPLEQRWPNLGFRIALSDNAREKP